MPPYKCSICGAEKCKLWRDYNTFLNHLSLYCVGCAMAKQKKEGIVREDGKFWDNGDKWASWTDAIGWLVPAVPTIENDTFWGYTSVPEDRVNWWRALPLRAT
jgi:hypothetical protein